MRLYLRASSLTISVLLTFNILTFIRGNGKCTSAVHRRDEAEGGWMQWDLLPSSSDKVNIDTPTAQHNTREYTPRKLVKVTTNTEWSVFWVNCKDHGGHIRRRLNALETHESHFSTFVTNHFNVKLPDAQGLKNTVPASPADDELSWCEQSSVLRKKNVWTPKPGLVTWELLVWKALQFNK